MHNRAKDQRMAGWPDRGDQIEGGGGRRAAARFRVRLPATFSPARTTTLDDTKLAQLKGELARIQNERIARQTRYELTQKYPPEQLAEVLDDAVLRGYQQQIEGLKREKAMLLTTSPRSTRKSGKWMPNWARCRSPTRPKISSVVKRIKHDYEASEKQEKALNGAYAGQSQRVGSEAGKVAAIQSSQREAETQRQMYQSLLMQQNQASLSSSVPMIPIRVSWRPRRRRELRTSRSRS